ncbi:MAG: hypothetical protein PHX78_00805 [bacterium]|nr:hypothetical protein [bacterium]
MKNKIILQIFIMMVLVSSVSCEQKVLLKDKINFIYSSSMNDLWIATSGGIYRIKDEKYNDAKNIKKGEKVTGIAEDAKKNIYFGIGKNVVCLNIGNEEKIITPFGMGREDSYIQSLAVDKNDNLWIGRNNDLLVMYNGDKFKTYPVWDVNSIVFSASGDIWIGAKSGIYFIKNDILEELKLDTSDLEDFEINNILIDDYDNLWLATNKGLFKYNNHIWIIYNTGNSKLKDDQVSSVYLDKNGSLMVGTRSGEIQTIKNNKWQELNPGLKNNAINTIYKDSKDILLLGTDSGLTVSK